MTAKDLKIGDIFLSVRNGVKFEFLGWCPMYYADKLEDAKEYHAGLKSGKYPKEHSFSMQYANKRVKELQKNYDLSVRLWGE